MKKYNILGFLAVIFILFVASCQYKFIVEPVPPTPPPGDTVSFSLDVIPIWNDGSNCVSCHSSSGGQKPHLTPNEAYDQINSMGLVDTQNPAESLIYKFPNPDTETHTWKKYTNAQAATVLHWIEQGAKNN
ncbi:MAG: hypothetical protein GXO86_08455 [Chlorobi bacterium]|nr:hypothetical protein [Chlorobiota bacterium]